MMRPPPHDLPFIPWIGGLSAPQLADAQCGRLAPLLVGRGPRGRWTAWLAILGLAVTAISLLLSHGSASRGSLSGAARPEPAWSKPSAEAGVPKMRRMQSLMAGTLGLGAMATSAVGQQAVQWRVEDGGNGHWFQIVVPTGASVSWEDARLTAETAGGHLATITSAAENNFAFSTAKPLDGWWVLNTTPAYCVGPWLGGYQPPESDEPVAGWRWVTEEPWSWTNWWQPANEPNNGCGGEDYLHWLAQGQTVPAPDWNDLGGMSCGMPEPKSFMVEWSADCNNDGIVDYGQILLGELVDANANNIPDCCEQGFPCSCPSDIDRNGTVDGVDLAIVLTNWGSDGGKDSPHADIDRSGLVDGGDLAAVLDAWGPCP
jgi:hypothetical protein